MEIYIDFKDKKSNVKAKTVKELLEKLKINPVTVIVTKGEEVVVEDSAIKKSDKCWADGKRLQMSGALAMPWKFIRIDV